MAEERTVKFEDAKEIIALFANLKTDNLALKLSDEQDILIQDNTDAPGDESNPGRAELTKIKSDFFLGGETGDLYSEFSVDMRRQIVISPKGIEFILDELKRVDEDTLDLVTRGQLNKSKKLLDELHLLISLDEQKRKQLFKKLIEEDALFSREMNAGKVKLSYKSDEDAAISKIKFTLLAKLLQEKFGREGYTINHGAALTEVSIELEETTVATIKAFYNDSTHDARSGARARRTHRPPASPASSASRATSATTARVNIDLFEDTNFSKIDDYATSRRWVKNTTTHTRQFTVNKSQPNEYTINVTRSAITTTKNDPEAYQHIAGLIQKVNEDKGPAAADRILFVEVFHEKNDAKQLAAMAREFLSTGMAVKVDETVRAGRSVNMDEFMVELRKEPHFNSDGKTFEAVFNEMAGAIAAPDPAAGPATSSPTATCAL